MLPVSTGNNLTALFTPDGKFILSADNKGGLMLWEKASGRLLHLLEGHVSRVTWMKFSSGSRYLLTCTNELRDNAIIWDLYNGTIITRLEGWGENDHSIAFISNNLVVSLREDTAKLYNIKTGKTVPLNKEIPNSAIFVGEQMLYRLQLRGSSLFLDRLDTISLEWKNNVQLQQEGLPDTAALAVSFNVASQQSWYRNFETDQQGKYVSIHANGLDYLYELATGKLLKAAPSAGISFDNETGIALFRAKKGLVLNLLTKDSMMAVGDSVYFAGPGYILSGMNYQKDGQWTSSSLSFTSLETGKLIRKLKFPGPGVPWKLPGGKVLYEYFEKKTGYRTAVIDARKAQVLYTLSGAVGAWYTFPYRDGQCLYQKQLLTVTDTSVLIWDFNTGKQLASLQGKNRLPGDLSFTNNNNFIFTGNKLIDVQTGNTKAYLPGKVAMVNQENDLAVMQTGPEEYALYSLADGKLVTQFTGTEMDELPDLEEPFFATRSGDSLLFLADLKKAELLTFKGSFQDMDENTKLLITATAVYPPDEDEDDDDISKKKKPARPPVTYTWNYTTGKLLHKIPGAFIDTFLPDEEEEDSTAAKGFQYLLAALPDSSTALYLPALQKQVILKGAYRLNNDKEEIIITTDKQNTYLYQTTSGKLLATIKGRFYAINWESYKKMLSIITIGGTGVYDIWTTDDIETGQWKQLYRMKGQAPQPVSQFWLSQDKKSFLVEWEPTTIYQAKKIVSAFTNGSITFRDTLDNWAADSAYRFFTALNENTIRLYDLTKGKLLHEFAPRKNEYFSVKPLGRSSLFEVTLRNSENELLLDPQQRKLMNNFFGYTENYSKGFRFWKNDSIGIYDFLRNEVKVYQVEDFRTGRASQDGKTAVLYFKNDIGFFDPETGKLKTRLPGTGIREYKNYFSTYTGDSTYYWSYNDYKQLAALPGKMISYISDDGLQVLRQAGNSVMVYQNFQKLFSITTADSLKSINYKKEGKLLQVETVPDGKQLYSAVTGRLIHPPDEWVLSDDGNGKTILGNQERTAIYLDSTHRLLYSVKGKYITYSLKKAGTFETKNGDTTFTWSFADGKLLKQLEENEKINARATSNDKQYELLFYEDGRSVIKDKTGTFTSAYFKVQLPAVDDRLYGRLLDAFYVNKDHTLAFLSESFSLNDIVNLTTGAVTPLLQTLFDEKIRVLSFTENNRYMITSSMAAASWNSRVRFYSVWDCATGRRIIQTESQSTSGEEQLFFSLSNDGRMFTTYRNGLIDLYSLENGRLLYQYFDIDKDNALITDDKGHYDGSTAARKLIYFTCGTEIIELDQVKDQLWVPGLAERIMTGDSINARTTADLSICGLTPQVEEAGSTADNYRYRIIPRRGGLGSTVLFVNGIEVKRYTPAQLQKKEQEYELTVPKKELLGFFVAGKENPVTVRAYTADNTISSRGIILVEDKTKEGSVVPPNLYAVMVGVSDYKGEALDLQYAAKDATDLGNMLGNAARKLLNTDEKEHVYIYNLTTTTGRYQLPEKKSIQKLLEEIGKKATANDILLIFFAGHGVMAAPAATDGKEEQKQFYFLTADASPGLTGSVVAEVGISTAELTEWMKPGNIKAQKRILIFDACNSGQAIRDFVKLGNNDQGYIAARSDEKSSQVKAIDKLNEQSGFFILSASASNQLAYEMGRYSQGLLTYSLLKTIKQQPDILQQGKYLDVSRWFTAAEATVTELTKENGARQQPQIISNTNFNIGIVDEEVMAKIILPQEKPLFTASVFTNADINADGDDLELSKLINLQLNDMASRGTDGNIIYSMGSNAPDAFTLSGRYEIKGNNITVHISIRQHKQVKQRFDLTGTTTSLPALAQAITEKAAGLVQ